MICLLVCGVLLTIYAAHAQKDAAPDLDSSRADAPAPLVQTPVAVETPRRVRPSVALPIAGPRGKPREEIEDLIGPPPSPLGNVANATIIESTGFEAGDGWDLSHSVCGDEFAYPGICSYPVMDTCAFKSHAASQNCCVGDPNEETGWYMSASSRHCREPHISSVNPFGGSARHLRFARDALAGSPAGCVGLNAACRSSAFTPALGPQPVGPTTISFELSSSSILGGSLRFLPVADSEVNSFAGLIHFFYGGTIYIYDFGANQYDFAGYWDDMGYSRVEIRVDPCLNEVTYSYGGQTIYSTSMTGHAATVERAFFDHDNDSGSVWDIDNFEISRDTPCCGNGVEDFGEECDPPSDMACPGQCGPDCTCLPSCHPVTDCNGNGIDDSCDIGPDGTGRKLYVTDRGNDRIRRANLDGSNVANVIPSGLTDPSDIEVDPIAGYLYWVDPTDQNVRRANLDGSGATVLVSSAGRPVALALDIASGKMYWSDSSLDRIQRANLNGTTVETLYSAAGIGPEGIDLDLANGKMYWTDIITNQIRRANLNGSTVEVVIGAGLSTPKGIAIDSAAGKMYWTEWGVPRIRRADLDGSNIQTLITTGLDRPFDLELDLSAGKMYWADFDLNLIKRANLDGTGVQTLISSGLSTPYGIALDLSSDNCNNNSVPDDCDLAGILTVETFESTGSDFIPDCPADHLSNPGLPSNILVNFPPGVATITDLNVRVGVNHSRIGDLFLFLTHQTTGTQVALMSRIGLAESDPYCTGNESGGCVGGNLYVTFDDEAASSIESLCIPAYGQSVRPHSGGSGFPGLLTAFDNEDMSGTWTLGVLDGQNGTFGTLVEWSLIITYRGNPASSDCNYNGMPDECDILGGLATDGACHGGLHHGDFCASDVDCPPTAGAVCSGIPPVCVGGPLTGTPCFADSQCNEGYCLLDGIPNECQGFTGMCTTPGIEDHWTCPGNWEPPTDYADDEGHFIGYHVKLLPGADICLDDTVLVPSLHIQPGAALQTTCGTVNPQPHGDLRFSPPGVLFVEGSLRVSGDRKIGEPGGLVGHPNPQPFIVGPGGLVGHVNPQPHLPVTATLHARDMVLLGGAPGQLGGKVELSSHMSAIISRNLTLTGHVDPQPFLPGGGVAGPITPPPKLRISDVVRLDVAGTMALSGVAEISVHSAAADAVSVGGDFDNRAISPSLFDWSEGALILTGPDRQTFEVAGIDLGNVPAGFYTDVDGLFGPEPHSNFSLGVLQIGLDDPPTAGHVTFTNAFANTKGDGACEEALYVRKLIVKPGSTITLDNCRLYYGELVGSVIPTVLGSCGPMVDTDLPATPVADANGKVRALSLTVPSSPPTVGNTALRVRLIELQKPLPANLPLFPPPDFSAYEFDSCSAVGETGGCARWVGRPGTFYESEGPPRTGPYRAARLQCTPYYYNWSAEGLFHIVGAELVPSSTYEVMNFAASCTGVESACGAVSAPTIATTRRSGDVDAPFNPPSTTNQPDAIDVAQVVNKFKGLAGAPLKASAQVQPNLPELNASISALDIASVVDAVKSFAYAFPGPCPCPSTVTCGGPCGVGACDPSAPGGPGMCVKTCTGGVNNGEPCINNTHCPGICMGGSNPGALCPAGVPGGANCAGGGICSASCASVGTCRDRCGRCTP